MTCYQTRTIIKQQTRGKLVLLSKLYNLYKLYQITDATKAEAMKKEYLQNILNRVMHKS
jgi:hypothetical protein